MVVQNSGIQQRPPEREIQKNLYASVATAKPSSKSSTESSHQARASIAIAEPSEIGKTVHTLSPIGNNTWIIDLGANDHMTLTLTMFKV